MKILVLNCGSSSIKYQLIEMTTKEVLAEGIAERIGEEHALFTYKKEGFEIKKKEMPIIDHKRGIEIILDYLTEKTNGVIDDIHNIGAVGHRLVHAGEHYSGSVMITKDVMNRLRECCILAPLHNPANIMGVEAVEHVVPEMIQCGVFDTAFHQTMPPRAFLYPLPLDLYNTHKIRRYGFHGTSHKFVSLKASEYLNKDINKLKIITCHIGNGASITAIDKGVSIDTSMGLTPLEGLVMGTRCGDIDPAIVIHLMKQLGYSLDEVSDLLNKKSGILGLSQLSNDMREIEESAIKGHCEKVKTALDVYCYRIKKYIGAYAAAMNGVDVVIFTGGVGENMPLLRSEVLADMDYCGIKLDLKANDTFAKGIIDLTAPDSKVKILKVPTNEELMIAMETLLLIEKK